MQWGFAGTTTSGRSIYGGNPNVGVSPIQTGSALPQPPLVATPTSSTGGSSTPGLPYNVNLGAGVTSGVGFIQRSPNFAIDLFISAAEAKGVGKLLSKPKVITQNNEKAIVKQGQKIPIQTTINNTISVQYIDAVLQLEVTPQITAEGTVFMDVLVENTQIDNGIPRVQGIPASDTQSAQTKVLVADGGTVVIGGDHHHPATDANYRGASGGKPAADWAPVQTHKHHHQFAPSFVLPHAANHPWLIAGAERPRRRKSVTLESRRRGSPRFFL